jgi:glucose-1-phosphate thymidylyltransferase
MKGIVLACGPGSALHPLTKVTNKHLLPVYDRPMIFYPLETLCNAGISQIMIVTAGSSGGDFLRLLGNGRAFGLRHLDYAYMDGEDGGSADAVGLCEHFAAGERVCVILGDTLLEDDIAPYAEAFEAQPSGARLLLKEVANPQRFDVAVVAGARIAGIEERPAVPKSRYAVAGVHFYDAGVFRYIEQMRPAASGARGLSAIHNAYLAAGALRYDVLPGWWTDAGRFETLHLATNLVAAKRKAERERRGAAILATPLVPSA